MSSSTLRVINLYEEDIRDRRRTILIQLFSLNTLGSAKVRTSKRLVGLDFGPKVFLSITPSCATCYWVW